MAAFDPKQPVADSVKFLGWQTKMPQFINVSFVVALGLVASACSRSSDFRVHPSSINCEELSCVVSFDVESLSEDDLSLVYEATLSQNHAQDPNSSGIEDVGVGGGNLSLRPKERRTVTQTVVVSETPNGSKVIVVPEEN